ncbi:hypothetical protein DPMN_167013 [Dreissena polymorpha]|uniref:Uncharacterized protein n=1 Tax=Dreissena polymorpha TaxID=45954 RepID=A0A9D4EZY7_DREPO|nr:hypothetical protein DPMN_167013 [Dreissena polymorpha]
MKPPSRSAWRPRSHVRPQMPRELGSPLARVRSAGPASESRKPGRPRQRGQVSGSR